MVRRTETITTHDAAAPTKDRIQTRHTIAALIYFLYGLFYLFGAQYLTSMQATARGMSNSKLFFVVGGAITIVFPFLIHSRFALALSLWRKAQQQRKTLFVSFTLILGLLVIARVIALIRGGLYAKTPLHTAALIIAAINAAGLVWAGLSQPLWISREPPGTS